MPLQKQKISFALFSAQREIRKYRGFIRCEFDGFKDWFAKLLVSKNTIEFLKNLEEIGLAHLSLEQSVQSLSSGEKQRLLLLIWLQDAPKDELFILDEPSTGLHYADIDLLYAILKKLSVENDILVIDHNPYLLEKIGVGLVLE